MAGSSWTRHCLRAGPDTPTAKATLVSRTRPSGTIADERRDGAGTASRQS